MSVCVGQILNRKRLAHLHGSSEQQLLLDCSGHSVLSGFSIQGTKIALCPCRQEQRRWFSPLRFWSLYCCFTLWWQNRQWDILFIHSCQQRWWARREGQQSRCLPAHFAFLAFPRCHLRHLHVAAGTLAEGQWGVQAQTGLPRAPPEHVRRAMSFLILVLDSNTAHPQQVGCSSKDGFWQILHSSKRGFWQEYIFLGLKRKTSQ